MLKPIDNYYRETKRLDGLWRFVPETSELSEPWTASLPGQLECPVPASYNDIFLHPSLRDHVGKVWYQRLIQVPRSWDGQRIFLRVDAATHEGEVYVGKHLVATHVGGYTPFEADLTDRVKAGEEVRITIGVNNILTNETIPPGKLVTSESGVVQQKYWHDFFNYAGLARSVRLCSTPKTRVDDITVRTELDKTTGLVHYEFATIGSTPDKAQIDLIDESGLTVASSSSAPTGSLTVPNAHLWEPGAAYLYKLRIRISADSGVTDEYTLPVGIRTVRVSGLQVLINNKPFYFKGFGKHEDTPIKGKGHDDAWMVHDFELMKWCGANSFRTSHYPYAEDVIEYADKHGWVVIDETPAVGLNLSIGGGLFGEGAAKTFSEDFANSRTQAAHKQAIEELVQRDKNHPSVIMWSITNEPDSGDKDARPYFEPLVALTRQLDPTRLVTYANVMFAKPHLDVIADLFDVIGLNRYYGWYVDTGDLASAEKHLESELREWAAKYQKPLVFFEYGADTLSGLHSLQSQPWSEEYQTDLLDMTHRVFDRIDAVVGEQIWNFADFGTGPGIFRVDGNKKGIFSRDRRPKSCAHALRKRWLGGK